MLYKCKSNQSLIKNKDLSLLHLTTLSNFLENEQTITQDITKEIVLLLPFRKMRSISARRTRRPSTSPSARSTIRLKIWSGGTRRRRKRM